MNHNYNHKNDTDLEVTCFIPGCADEAFIGQLEQVIPQIAEAVAEHLMEDSYDPICMVMSADGTTAILPLSKMEGDYGKSSCCFSVHNDLLLLRCEHDDVVKLGGQPYLVGAAIIYEIDEDGEDCDIDGETVSMAMEFFEDNLTEIQVDGTSYPAVRLV